MIFKFFIFFILFNTANIFAFTLDSTSNPNYRGWRDSEVQFVVNQASCPSSVDITALLSASFEVWHKIPGTKLKLKVVGQTTLTGPSYPVVVRCVATMGAGNDDNIPASASVGRIGDYAASGEIQINGSAGAANVSRYDANLTMITLAHEVGHIFGLGHSHDTSALMYFNGSVKTVMSLNQDDIDGVSYLYPSDELGSDKPLGCGLVKNMKIPPPSSGNLSILFLILILPLLTAFYLGRRKQNPFLINFNLSKMKYMFLMGLLIFSNTTKADMFKSTLFSLNTIYLDRDYDDNGFKTKSKQTDTDFRIIRIEKYWSYGAIYSLSANDASDAGRSSYGLSLGYFSEKDFYMNLHYFVSSKYRTGGVDYTKGNGYEFDVGFLSKVTSSFYVGLLVALKNFSYTEQTVAGLKSSITSNHKEVIPMFSFGVNFM
jgi:hypothetical protein